MSKKLKEQLIMSGFIPLNQSISKDKLSFGEKFKYLDNGLPNLDAIDFLERRFPISNHPTFHTLTIYVSFEEIIPELTITVNSEGWITKQVQTISDIEKTVRDNEFDSSFKDFKIPTSKDKNCLYIIANGNRCKIGITDNIFRRFNTIQAQSPYKLKLILISFNSYHKRKCIFNLEKRLHLLFKDKRVHGEWFELSDFEMENIMAIVWEIDFFISDYKNLGKNFTIDNLNIQEECNFINCYYPKKSSTLYEKWKNNNQVV